MSTIVGAIATVHAPLIFAMPHLASEEKRAAVAKGFSELASIVKGLAPDVVVCATSEHVTNFLSTNAAPFCVGIGDPNPTQPEFGLPDLDVPGHPEFARGLVEWVYRAGFDVAHSAKLFLDHGTNLPLHLITPAYDVPVVPLMINTIWAPMPSAARCFDLGAAIANYVANDGKDLRVLLMGTGGISHWVGNEHHGQLNQEFDEWFLAQISQGNSEALRGLDQAAIDVAGDGGNEIRNWITVMGAAEAAALKPKVVLDETFIPGWNVSVYQLAWV